MEDEMAIPKCGLCKVNPASCFVGYKNMSSDEPYYYCASCRAEYPPYTQNSFIELDAIEWAEVIE